MGGDATGIWWVKSMDATKYPVMPTRQDQESSWSNVNGTPNTFLEMDQNVMLLICSDNQTCQDDQDNDIYWKKKYFQA